ncbi:MULTISPECIES: hypothetical protein [Symbiopectobacterium]|uniref:hypothetical protein n=1 Tax=Symbiopectobacterium TaxID=801 RepID=UPI001A20FBD8|nr:MULTISPECIES: hypothetical protein [Symbiopectobacterium]MBG6247011.1 hypothetical protein [Candidatus Symbiopectobacterium sp. PLON1]MBT9429082.1 hypothetical protein [Candidatus Symbiopectobacterium endolongispinus]
MKAYFDENASLCVEAENSAEKAALTLWCEVNALNGMKGTTLEAVVDSNNMGLLLMVNGAIIFDTPAKTIDGNANSNAGGVTPEFQKALPEEVKELKDKNTLSDSRTKESEPDESGKSPAQENPDTGTLDDNPDPEFAGAGNPSDPVETAFEDIFWVAGLRKDAKAKSKSAFRTKFTAWKKITRGSADEFAQMLADDIGLRLRTGVFGFDRLLPASYLNGERWNDEKPTAQGGSGSTPGDPKPFVYNDPNYRLRRHAKRHGWECPVMRRLLKRLLVSGYNHGVLCEGLVT